MAEFDQAKIRRLDGGLLLVFHELLRRRRATEVGLALGLSPSAISHALTRLRDLYGDPLFIRRPHGLEPTARALELGPQVEALLAMAGETLAADAPFDPATSTRWFVISAPEFVGALIGARLTRALEAAAPKVGFEVRTLAPDEALEAVRRGDLDLALGRFPRMRPGLETELLFEDDYCIVARRGHPRVDGGLTLAQYAGERQIFAGAESEVGEDLEAPALDSLRVQAVVPKWLTVLTMVAATDGLGTCPQRLAESQAETLGLQVIPVSEDFMAGAGRRLSSGERSIRVMAARREGKADPGLAWFLERVREAAA